ncbi:Signal transduction histidine-protein kinase BarA [Maioricimonas rarisocia]|uniref:histidine kinase n=1 Tax=Maioricimonas rarisocia TaxID=2528026 RepID=A0A517Z7W2_9PLAN|nr:response regulator [Maioricimonas rarisocia]QDU38568.1 Signal transduction histidine-protein kinase BarA [Maioricimonas rarisocia]
MIEFLSGNRIDYACFALVTLGLWGGMLLDLRRQGVDPSLVRCGWGLTLIMLLTGGLVVLAQETAGHASADSFEPVALRWAAFSMLTVLTGGGMWLIGRIGQLRLNNRLAEQQAERSADARSRFLHRVSHEVRTPLNGVFGMAHLLQETSLTSRQNEYVEMIESSARWLETIINDVLDYSHITLDAMHVVESDFVLQEVLGDILERFSDVAEQKGIHLNCSTTGGVPERLHGNGECLKQVLIQLVDNAVRFTEHGHVRVNVSLDATASDGGHCLHFSIEDTGEGIPQDRIESIFDEFTQQPPAESQFGGSGLGLAICRKLVNRLGGRIWAVSFPGQGTTFHVTLTMLQAQNHPTVSDAEASSLRGRSVLLLDADPVSRAILQSVLRSWGMRPRSALHGAEIERLMSSAADAGHPFDFVVIDEAALERSELNRILAHIRNGALGRPRSLLLVTGQAAAPVGAADACVAKEQLPGSLLSAFQVEPAAEHEQFDETAATLTSDSRKQTVPLRVLLAEDNSVNQVYARSLLEKRGHTVTVVADGQRAVAEALSGRHDLVLMDIQMPRLDGLTATRQIREREQAHPTSRKIPIIALTAYAMPGDRHRCLEAGMDGYVAKPIRPQKLYAVIDLLTAQAETPSSEPSDPPHNEAPAASSCPDTPGPVDWDAARRRTAHDLALLNSVCEIFLPDSETLLRDIRSAASRGDFPMVRRTAHTLKGTLGYFGVPDAVAAAETIEQMGAHESLDDFPVEYERLRELVDQVRSDVEQRLRTTNSSPSAE